MTSCLTLVAVNLLLIFGGEEGINWWGWLLRSLLILCQCDVKCTYVYARTHQKWVTTLGQLQGIFNWQLIVVCVCERARESVSDCVCETENGCEGQAPPCADGHSLTFHCFHFSITPFSFLCFPSCSGSISLSSQAGFGYTMASWDWEAAIMIGGLFIYNHKGEVLISRVYRDDIGYVSREQSCCNVREFLRRTCRWQRSCGGEQLILKGWERIMFLFFYVYFLVSSEMFGGTKLDWRYTRVAKP